MRIDYDRKLDFNDVLIRPKRSTLSSRAGVDITRTFRFIHTSLEWTGFPIIASNMDAIGTFRMARALAQANAMVALHKHYGAEELVEFFEQNITENTFVQLGSLLKMQRSLHT